VDEVALLTRDGVMTLSYEAVLWIVERVGPDVLEETVSALDIGLERGVTVLPPAELASFVEWLEAELAALPQEERAEPAPAALAELVAAVAPRERG